MSGIDEPKTDIENWEATTVHLSPETLAHLNKHIRYRGTMKNNTTRSEVVEEALSAFLDGFDTAGEQRASPMVDMLLFITPEEWATLKHHYDVGKVDAEKVINTSERAAQYDVDMAAVVDKPTHEALMAAILGRVFIAAKGAGHV